jgi:hypothetical protein
MNGPGADAERLGRLEDACAGRQLSLDTLDDIARDGTTPQTRILRSDASEAGIDPFRDLGRRFRPRNCLSDQRRSSPCLSILGRET